MKWSGKMTKIRDLKEKDRLRQPLLIKSCTKGTTSKGSPYLNLILQDNSGTIDAKFWDAKPEDMENAVAGTVAELNFEVLEYNHALQLRVNSIVPLDQKSIRMNEYLQASVYTEEELRSRMMQKIDSLQNANLRTLVSAMLERVEKRFYAYPAASRIHHSYLGGLAEHTLGMAALAEAICELYPQLNRDLLISGILIHDMGKTVELGGLVSSEYTEEGRLTGHISICHGWLMETAAETGLADSEEAILLRHMVLSHHGKQEYGSPVLPALQEAEVLFLIDNMDARLNTLKTALAGVAEGAWTSKMFSMEGRQFYKPKI